MSKKRVAIIGAGPSGLAQLRAFQSAQAKGTDETVKILVFQVSLFQKGWLNQIQSLQEINTVKIPCKVQIINPVVLH